MPRLIDTENWYRKKAYEFFKGFPDPFFNMTAEVEITRFYQLTKDHGLSFNSALLYYTQATANSIPEFRTRIENDDIVEYESVEATQTMLQDDDSFSFCYFKAAGTLREYCEKAIESVAHYKELSTFDVEAGRQDLIYYSSIPWISFTSFKHASDLNPKQSVPRVVFGKYKKQEGGVVIPISVEANHIVMDGLHVGRYYQTLQSMLNECAIDD